MSFTAEEVRNEKVKVLHAIHAPTARARSPRSPCARSTPPGTPAARTCPATCEEDGVRAGSTTETFAALRLEVDNWRWAGVPFYLRAGKRLARKITEIAVTLKPVPHLAFSQDGSLGVQPNQLVLTLQPNEGVSLQLGAKIPGTRMRIRSVNMEFLYGTAFLSQSPGGLRAADHGRDARRRDAVHAQRRGRGAVAHLRPDRAGVGERAGTRCRSTKPARRGPRRRTTCCSTATAGARSDPMPAVSDAVWSEQGTTPDAIEAALRELLAERHAENDGFLPARVLNMVAFVESEYSGEIANRLRGVGRYHASRLIVLSYEPRRTRLDAHASVAAEGEATARRARAAARDRDRRARRPPPRRPADDRRPARRHRPADAAVVAARPPRGRRGAAAARAGDAAGLGRRARLARGDRPRQHALRARSTSSTSPGCARRRGASGSRPPSTRPRCAASSSGSPRSRSATTPTRRSRRCC